MLPSFLWGRGSFIQSSFKTSIYLVETATAPPKTGGSRRRKRKDADDISVDDFDQKLIKKLPFLKYIPVSYTHLTLPTNREV